jgi:hypothetical protein
VSCDEVRKLLPDYALGAVTEAESSQVRRHIRGCASCRAEAEKLDEGLALFAAAAHEVDPPDELEDRVLRVLKAEWSEPVVEPTARRPGAFRRLTTRSMLALAAAFVLVAGSLVWGVANQVRANNLAADAGTLRHLLDTLGGKDVRVGPLTPAPNSMMEGSFLIYDGTGEGESWVLVLVRAPGYSGPANVELLSRTGGSISMHAIEVEQDGEGWTGLFSQSDLGKFNAVRVTSPSGALLASGHATQAHH